MANPSPLKSSIWLDHDGSVDDFVALTLALMQPSLELIGIAVTDADCHLEPAVAATRAICRLMGREVPVHASAARARNPFPAQWREESWLVSNLPLVRARSDPESGPLQRDAVDVLRRQLIDRNDDVHVVVTGPLTTLAELHELDRTTYGRIDRMTWMGGAFDVPGNVVEHGRDGTAEWNAYWDAPAAQAVVASCVPMTVVPLDATRLFPIRDGFLAELSSTPGPVADLVAHLYGLVRHRYYEAWDMLTVAAVCWPDLFDFEERRIEVITEGRSEGRTIDSPAGDTHRVVVDVNVLELSQRFLEAASASNGRWSSLTL